MQTPARADTTLMSLDRYRPFENRGDVGVVIRDTSLNLLWCNHAYATAFDADREKLVGTGMESLFDRAFAAEREALMRPTIEESRMIAYDQIVRGRRYLTRVWALDPSEFGKRGVFIVAEPCATPDPMYESGHLRTALQCDLGDLDLLTRRELEIFRLLAEGMTGQQIADTLHRSPKTIEFHTARILSSLSLRNRTELARLAAERGLLGFSRESWFALIASRPAARKSAAKVGQNGVHHGSTQPDRIEDE